MKAVAVLLLLLGVAHGQQTLLSTIQGNPDLSFLAAALAQFPDLGDALTAFKGTIFAPNNKAFQDALALIQASGLEKSVTENLDYILRYHLIPQQTLNLNQLSDGLVLATADQDKDLTIKYVGGKPTIEGIGSTATIITPDVSVGGDVVMHIVDAVLLPIVLPTGPAPTPAGAPGSTGAPGPAAGPAAAPLTAPLSTRAIYESVVEAAKAEGLDSLVAALEATDLAGALGPDFNGTVFAPTNKALESFLEDASIDLSAATEAQLAAVSDLLTYHVIPGVVALGKDFTNNEVLATLNGEPVTILVRKKGIVVEDAAGNKIDVTIPNIKAGDAVIHVIDGVLVPNPMAPAPVPAPAPLVSGATTAATSLAAVVAALLAALLM